MDTPLADGKGVFVDAYGNAQFSRDVIARFPSLSDLELDAELLHPQVGTLAAAVREAVRAGDTHLPLQICMFIDEALSKPNAIAEIENAVALSFVEAYELRATATGKAGPSPVVPRRSATCAIAPELGQLQSDASNGWSWRSCVALADVGSTLFAAGTVWSQPIRSRGGVRLNYLLTSSIFQISPPSVTTYAVSPMNSSDVG
jgi:hypothetical protein